ncbi:MAG: TetR family transcriptional regulator [Sterolibacterium sp.]|nr:TetR family transcriptional regulator [Sterolibacterium sp.]
MSETDTRNRILRAAELLFIEHGFEATTLRQITGKARVNLAAVNYHFGSKDQLIEEIFRQRLGWLNEQCLRELDQLEAAADGEPLRPRQILEAFFGVSLRLAADKEGGGNNFMRLLGRTYTAPTPAIRDFLVREYAAAVPRFKMALFRALPDVPKEEILWRFHFMLGAMSYATSGADALNVLGGLDDSDSQALHARLMAFLIGGLRAPLAELPPKAAGKRTKQPD